MENLSKQMIKKWSIIKGRPFFFLEINFLLTQYFCRQFASVKNMASRHTALLETYCNAVMFLQMCFLFWTLTFVQCGYMACGSRGHYMTQTASSVPLVPEFCFLCVVFDIRLSKCRGFWVYSKRKPEAAEVSNKLES